MAVCRPSVARRMAHAECDTPNGKSGPRVGRKRGGAKVTKPDPPTSEHICPFTVGAASDKVPKIVKTKFPGIFSSPIVFLPFDGFAKASLIR